MYTFFSVNVPTVILITMVTVTSNVIFKMAAMIISQNLWNDLPESVVKAKTAGGFKTELNNIW